MKSNRLLKIALALSITVIAGLSFWSFKVDQKNFEISKNLDIFYTLFRELNLFYVDEVEPEKLIKSGIDDMLESLDPYTVYIPESDMDDFKFMTTGEYAGIGALIRRSGDKIVVAEPYEGFPAQKSGLKAGDIFVEVDGKQTDKLDVSAVSEMLKGPVKQPVRLKMLRPGNDKPFTAEIVREEIQINPVTYYGMVEQKTGYIRLSSFTDGCSDKVKEAFLELRDKSGAERMILDLRSNPGGLLGEAVKMSNLFVRQGDEIVSTRGKVKQWDKTYRATEQPIDSLMPLIVLVNRGSASASEIVAGALQDLDRAVVMGNRTFGKGLVQTTRDLSYNTKLKVTTSKYYIPSGRCIQAMDYSHRNEDGSVGAVPDSLISEYSTRNGRKVYDGGGILPDIVIPQDTIGEMVIKLIQDNMFFDFSTEYTLKHSQLASPDKFEVDNALYEEFHQFLLKKSFVYQSLSQQALEKLKEAAQREMYYDQSKEQFSALEQSLKQDLNQDLQRYRKDISDLITDELVTRYYYQKGAVIASLRTDKEIAQALTLLGGSDEYAKVLQPKPVDTQVKKR